MPTNRRIDVVLLAVAVVWGSSYLTAKTATDALPVPTVLFVRYAVAALACAAVLRRFGGAGGLTRDEKVQGSLLGLTQAAVLVLETYGVAHTSAGNAGLIISLTLVLTPVLHRVGLPARFFLAAGVCLAGVAVLVSGNGLRAPGAGDLLMLAAAVVRAGHMVLVGRVTAGRTLRPLHLTAVQCAVGAALFLLPAAPGLPALTRTGAVTWAQLLYLSLFCGLFAFIAQTWAVQRTSATRAGLLLGTEPVWALLVGTALGGERLTGLSVLGAALIVTGTYWGQSVERAHRGRAMAAARDATPRSARTGATQAS
ncbi:MAG: DMT family transporter [Streptomyces sp.]|uniref:DMT family transporter n=1 Tax=Streptomyces sp. TaxID=1931 RepID=UPI0025EC0B44|nr:DMT family transporter [Streptomyces sp.]MBW8799352.1 DMT family transporter [Streptomyces sp.]